MSDFRRPLNARDIARQRNEEIKAKAEGLTSPQIAARWGLHCNTISVRLRQLGFVPDTSTHPAVWRKAPPKEVPSAD